MSEFEESVSESEESESEVSEESGVEDLFPVELPGRRRHLLSDLDAFLDLFFHFFRS